MAAVGCTSRQTALDQVTGPTPAMSSQTLPERSDPVPDPPIAGEAHQRAGLSTAVAAGAAKALAAADASASSPGYAAGIVAAEIPSDIRTPTQPVDREQYAHYDDNPVKGVAETPVSTFSIDVDTASYSNARRAINSGRLPVKDAVRVEEFINYFDYDYPVPNDRRTPFRVTTELGPNPWNEDTRLLQIGIKGYEVPAEKRPSANLVFLVDVSGSMQSPDKLPLLKSALTLLTQQLRKDDHIAIVVYAGASGVVLEPTAGDHKATIVQALDALSAGGSTNGASGIRLAYELAAQHFEDKGINRVILATDGDFNVGTVDFEALKNLIEQERKSGVSLTTLGFGSGNYNDRLMEQLADAGNGNYAYVDSLNEAQKVLVDELGSTLQTIAKDVKIQIEFNPALVAEYRLIGYEDRVLRREDFNNDRIDAGDIGAGHTVTAIYELALTGGRGSRIDPLRYARPEPGAALHGDELAVVRLRYKEPDGDTSRLVEHTIARGDLQTALERTSERYRFAAAVAAFGQLLRGGAYLGDFGYADALALARTARGDDAFGYRGEFIGLVNLAQSLDRQVLRAGR